MMAFSQSTSLFNYLQLHHVENHSHDNPPYHYQVLGGWRLGGDGSTQKSDAYFCGGGNTTTVPDIYGQIKNGKLLKYLYYNTPAEGGPHMVLVTTDEGVRYSDGALLQTTASQADKV